MYPVLHRGPEDIIILPTHIAYFLTFSMYPEPRIGWIGNHQVNKADELSMICYAQSENI